jgi:hypothetical protein
MPRWIWMQTAEACVTCDVRHGLKTSRADSQTFHALTPAAVDVNHYARPIFNRPNDSPTLHMSPLSNGVNAPVVCPQMRCGLFFHRSFLPSTQVKSRWDRSGWV